MPPVCKEKLKETSSVKHLFGEDGKIQIKKVLEAAPDPNCLPEFWEPPTNYLLDTIPQPWDKMAQTILSPKFDMMFYVNIHRDR
jgi:hypothetical protein